MRYFAAAIFVGVFLNLSQVKSAGINNAQNYEDYQILSADIQTASDLKLMKSLRLRDDLDFWKFPTVGGEAQIMVHKDEADKLISLLASNNIKASVTTPNVNKILEEERLANTKSRNVGTLMTWDGYQTWETMEDWIKSLNQSFVTVVGFSSESRPIYMVKVTNGPSTTNKPKKAIFIEANIHAREWISSAVATFIINELTTKPNDYMELLDHVDLYINPMSNPDGYAYTHHNTSTRLWRKTRSINLDSDCLGCDPNRNFEFMWGGESTSSNPCSDTFHGRAPWSEPEVRAIRDAMITIRSGGQEIQSYIGLHACGNVWLLSWGWTEGIYPEDYSDLVEWGTGVVAKIKEVNGTQFKTGQGADIFYGVGGASDDYAKSSGIKYATTAELRCGSGTGGGFILPPEQIIPTALEVLAGVIETGRRIVADDEAPEVTTTPGATSTPSAAISFNPLATMFCFLLTVQFLV